MPLLSSHADTCPGTAVGHCLEGTSMLSFRIIPIEVRACEHVAV